MATQQYIADIQTNSAQLTGAMEAIDNALDQGANEGWPKSVRDQLKELHGDAMQKRNELDASVRILEQHLKSKPKLLKLVSEKYRNARQFIENARTELRTLTERLNNLRTDIFRD
jgi:hypothetical protein